MTKTIQLIHPQWPAPTNIKAFTSQRTGGKSASPYNSLNLAEHVDDNALLVQTNRELLGQFAGLPTPPLWLNQTHTTQVVCAETSAHNTNADASYSLEPNTVCTVMTADCLPLLLCNKQGNFVSAVHAGWRGLANGIVENAVQCYPGAPEDCYAWLGPAIGPQAFEVGAEVREAFVSVLPEAQQAFQAQNNGKYLGNLYLLAKQRLAKAGVTAVFGGEYCTFSQAEQFFSYRRDGETGRMATMIWYTSNEKKQKPILATST